MIKAQVIFREGEQWLVIRNLHGKRQTRWIDLVFLSFGFFFLFWNLGKTKNGKNEMKSYPTANSENYFFLYSLLTHKT